MNLNATITCRHCGEVVRELTMHGRTLHNATREQHDREIRRSDLVDAKCRAMYDREHIVAVLTGYAERHGRTYTVRS